MVKIYGSIAARRKSGRGYFKWDRVLKKIDVYR